MTERCELTDMLADQCAHCTGRRGHEAPRDLTVVSVFPARYPGRCAACDTPFGEGDRLGRTGDGEYVGPECLP